MCLFIKSFIIYDCAAFMCICSYTKLNKEYRGAYMRMCNNNVLYITINTSQSKGRAFYFLNIIKQHHTRRSPGGDQYFIILHVPLFNSRNLSGVNVHYCNYCTFTQSVCSCAFHPDAAEGAIDPPLPLKVSSSAASPWGNCVFHNRLA